MFAFFFVLHPFSSQQKFTGNEGKRQMHEVKCSPTEIGGKAPLDYIRARIHPRGLCLSRLPLTSQKLIDNLNGKIR